MADKKLTSTVYLQKCHTTKHCHFTGNFSFLNALKQKGPQEEFIYSALGLWWLMSVKNFLSKTNENRRI